MDFSWAYSDPDGDPQSEFEFKITSEGNVNAEAVVYRPRTSGSTHTQTVSVSIDPVEDQELAYNQYYYWWIRVWDSQGNTSGWIQGFPSTGAFATVSTPYPYPDFSFSPASPNLGVEVTFEDISKCYKWESDSLQEYDCKTDSANRYQWDFGNGVTRDTGTGYESIWRGDATTSYNVIGPKVVELEITDELEHSCSLVKNIDVSVKLPEWKEIKPF